MDGTQRINWLVPRCNIPTGTTAGNGVDIGRNKEHCFEPTGALTAIRGDIKAGKVYTLTLLREVLMSFFEQLLMRHRSLPFALIWITITVGAVTWGALAVGQVAAPISQKGPRPPISLILTWRRAGASRAVAALTLLAVFLVAYIVMALLWEDFAYYDDAMLTLSTLKGHNLSLLIDPRMGRFFPLGLQEFNLIRHFTDTITGYYVLPIVELLIFSWILLILDDELSITARAVLVILALSTPSILISFDNLKCPERSVLLFLTCLVLSVKRFEQTKFIGWAVATVICAQIMIYTKETAFLLVLGFAVSRLILRCKNADFGGWSYDRLWIKESRLDLCLASLAVLFLIVYVGFVGNVSMRYATSAPLLRADIVLGYTRVDLLPWLLIAAVLGRIYLILYYRVEPLLLWDGLAVGGVACFLAYLYLIIFGVYYLAPVDLIAVLYVGRLAVLSWGKIRSWGKIAAMLLAFIVLFQHVLVSAYALFERKNVIHAKAEIASVVETQYRLTGNDLRLFFPFASGYMITEFVPYLNYRGIPVEGVTDEASRLNSVGLAARHIADDGRCPGWTSIRCQDVDRPALGDLVIVLPDDKASLAEASVYRERGELLLYYNPRPPIPHWLYRLFDGLHLGPQYGYRYDTLPDRWMDGSVTKWR
jgi:hypothetical protein